MDKAKPRLNRVTLMFAAGGLLSGDSACRKKEVSVWMNKASPRLTKITLMLGFSMIPVV